MSGKRIFLSPPHMSGEEIKFVHESFDTNYIAPLGPMVEAFEREFAEYTGIPHCVALSSGTAAMHLALREIGVGPCDEVIASTLTFIGSVSPATFLGGAPVFLDSDRESWNMDPNLLEEELKSCAARGKLPKAVVPTDLYGQCADMERILEICASYEVPVVSDAAEAMGARRGRQESGVRSQKSEVREDDGSPRRNGEAEKRGSGVTENTEDRPAFARRLRRGAQPTTTNPQPTTHNPQFEWLHAGVGAKAAVFSFNGNKIMTTGGGGMLASEDKALIEHARKLSQQARDPAPHYEHTEIGYNYRMSGVLAGIGRGQLRALDQRVERRREIFQIYRKLLGDLPGVEFMPEPEHSRSNRWLTVALVSKNEFKASPADIRQALEAQNIEARPVWKPMHLQPVFKGCRVRGGAVAEDLFDRGICLPSGTAMTQVDLELISGIIRSCSNSGR